MGLREAANTMKCTEDATEKSTGDARQRASYVTVHAADYARLEPDRWWNDALVDLWMLWYVIFPKINIASHFAFSISFCILYLTFESRLSRDNTSLDSNIHVFTTHFYSTLQSTEGLQRVTSWTSKINILDKRLVFIPIHKDSHWSLCVIVNPGAIVKDGYADHQRRQDEPPSCLIFMDSLQVHNTDYIANNIRKWLNDLWGKGRKQQPTTEQPKDRELDLTFNSYNFRMFCPEGKYV